ncbi:hypothetical protein PWT90_04940 [Aphanocladium album]|nr:hypothetical protein PWT90_04940 [Aphanocladium album]
MAAGQVLPGDVEILVHVTAPGRVSDDATYRRLAQAYLSFAPGSRAHVTIPSSPEPQQQQQQQQQPPPSRQSQYDDEFTVLQSFCSDSQDMSFQGALDNLHSPRVVSSKPRVSTPQPQVLPDEHVTTPTTAVRQLPSQIADSYPMPDCDMFNVTPTRVLQRYMGSRQPTAATPAAPPAASPTLSSDGDGDAPVVKTEAEALLVGISSSLPTSETTGTQENRERRQATIPVTPLASYSARKRKAADADAHDTSALDVTHISSSIPASSDPPSAGAAALQRAESDPLPAKRLRRLAQDSSAVHLIRGASDTTIHPLHNTPPFSSPLSYHALSQIPSTLPYSLSSSSSLRSVRPPSPPVGVDNLDLASLVSAKLAKLAADLSSRYRPVAHRALDPLERGHWRVDCDRWPADARADAWAFLTSYVRSGLAGWGVWCRRSGGGEEEDGGRVIKLYGWAHVAKHTYLLLYLASGRQIKATGARWFDADGVVALEVVP